MSRTTPSAPHLRHHGSDSITRHSITARPASIRCPTASRPSSSSRQNVVRSGAAKVALSTSRSFRWLCRNFHHRKASTSIQLSTRRFSQTPVYTLVCEEPDKLVAALGDTEEGRDGVRARLAADRDQGTAPVAAVRSNPWSPKARKDIGRSTSRKHDYGLG